MAGEFGYVASLVGLFALVFWWESLTRLRASRAQVVEAFGRGMLRSLTLALIGFTAVVAVVVIILAATAGGDLMLRLAGGLLDLALWLVSAVLLATILVAARMGWRQYPGPFIGLVGALPFAAFFASFTRFRGSLDGVPWLVPLAGGIATLAVCLVVLWRIRRLLESS